MVNKLLEQKVNVDAQGKQGVTALMLAAENNQVEIVKLLLKKNADPNLEDQTGWTALMKAVYQGNTTCVEALAARSRQEVNRGLLIAALTGHKEIAKILLDNGAEVDSRADDGRTPLMLAAIKGDSDLVSLLLKAGADPTLTDKSGATAGIFGDGERIQRNSRVICSKALSLRAPAHTAKSGSPARDTAEPAASMSDQDLLFAASWREKRCSRFPRRGQLLASSTKAPDESAPDKTGFCGRDPARVSAGDARRSQREEGEDPASRRGRIQRRGRGSAEGARLQGYRR